MINIAKHMSINVYFQNFGIFCLLSLIFAVHCTLQPPPPNTIRVKMYIHDMIQFVFELIPVKVKKDKVTYFCMNSFNLLYFQEYFLVKHR